MGSQHLCVVHDLALVGGDLQRGQHVVHAGQAGGGARRRVVKAPLEDVEAWPARYVGALLEWRMDGLSHSETGRPRGKAEVPFPDLHALPFLAGQCSLHHAVVLPQHPVLVDQLGTGGPERRQCVAAQSVPLGRLRRPLGVVDVEDHVALGHVKVPGDDGAGLRNLDQHLQEDGTSGCRSWVRGGCNVLFCLLGAPRPKESNFVKGIWNCF